MYLIVFNQNSEFLLLDSRDQHMVILLYSNIYVEKYENFLGQSMLPFNKVNSNLVIKNANLCLKKMQKRTTNQGITSQKYFIFRSIFFFFTKFSFLLNHWHFMSFSHQINSYLKLHELESTKFYLIYVVSYVSQCCVYTLIRLSRTTFFAFSFSTCLHVPKEFRGLYINCALQKLFLNTYN